MTQTLARVLAINPGTHYLGLAFFEGPELGDWFIKGLKGPWSQAKHRRIIELVVEAFDFYEPRIVVIKRFHPSRSSDQLANVVREIKRLALSQGQEIHEYGIDTLKIRLAGSLQVNKGQLAELMAQRYPLLLSRLDAERHNRNPYHVRLFEAVALGVCCLQVRSLDHSQS